MLLIEYARIISTVLFHVRGDSRMSSPQLLENVSVFKTRLR